MIAYCGLNCSQCPALLAAQQDDDEKRKVVAEAWSKEFNAAIKPEDINCDGCMTENGRLFSHCHVCKIRKCCQGKDLKNCAYCEEYACKDLSFIINAVPEAKAALEAIRKNL